VWYKRLTLDPVEGSKQVRGRHHAASQSPRTG
jgi:hypothetical protein